MSPLAVYLGPDDLLAERIRGHLTAAGFRLVAPDSQVACDLFIDNASRTPAEARVAAYVSGQAKHYVFISSHRVYPATASLRPWRVDDINVVSDQAPWASAALVAARATEREVRLLAHAERALTILRPSCIEGITPPYFTDSTDTIDLTDWLVTRVLEGELVVLPDGDLPSYKRVSVDDLATAIVAVALKTETYGQTLNIANSALLSYWGHAALVRDGLHRPSLRFGYVPHWRWQAAGLALPGLSDARSSLIETSEILYTLGWKPEDPVLLLTSRAQACAEAQRYIGHQTLALERQVLKETEAQSLYQPGQIFSPLPIHTTRQWNLSAWAGKPASLCLERHAQPHAMPTPLVKVRALTLMSAEERLLRGEYPQHGRRAIGHNALLEVLTSNTAALPLGSLAIAVSAMPCGDSDCRFCAGGNHGVLGIGCDGYGLGICSTPAGHLVPTPPLLRHAALLADPLACLSEGLCGERWAADQGPVWIAGRTVEAALVAWLAQDAGRPVVHVDRRAWAHEEFTVEAVDALLVQVQSAILPAPTLAFDFTGSTEVSWSLSHALAKAGHLFVQRRPPGIAQGIYWHHLPAAAPNRAALEKALTRLEHWARYHDLSRRIGPAIPLDLFWDALLPVPFALPYLEDLT
jgi:nucleoside-diphosphate-sugar epimerase